MIAYDKERKCATRGGEPLAEQEVVGWLVGAAWRLSGGKPLGGFLSTQKQKIKSLEDLQRVSSGVADFSDAFDRASLNGDHGVVWSKGFLEGLLRALRGKALHYPEKAITSGDDLTEFRAGIAAAETLAEMA